MIKTASVAEHFLSVARCCMAAETSKLQINTQYMQYTITYVIIQPGLFIIIRLVTCLKRGCI